MKQVLDVGQCDYDHQGIKALCTSVGEVLGTEVKVLRAHTTSEALQQAITHKPDLVLVNRLLDLDHSEGLDVIKAIRAEPTLRATQIMLVSNFPEAHTTAVAGGALPGFGKKQLRAPETLALLAKALSSPSTDLLSH